MTGPPAGPRLLLAGAPPAIVADGLHLTYRLLVERPGQQRAGLVGRRPRSRVREIHAVRETSFAIASGEAVGVIGHNGCGKTSLLRAIGGLLPVSAGRVRVSSTPVLLGVRAALEPGLSARQNVLLGGASLRLPREELRGQVDDILRFAGVEAFADVPLRAFSAGMRARLQFSIATAVSPEILLIDEALSVGDAEFKARSDARIRELIDAAGTVLLVSHSMRSVLDVCTRVLWLDHGRLVADGSADEVVRAYAAHVRRRREDDDH